MEAAPPTHIIASALIKIRFDAAGVSLLALNHSFYLALTYVQFHVAIDAQNMPPPVVV
jgi:threonine/homoserine efflux transporter RhtA